MTNKIDHFAIGAANLDDGVAALQHSLGVTVPRGSKHAAMSTHNCVMQAGNGSFLEILANDPEAPHPGRHRWFGLDDPATRSRLAKRPHALCWVVATEDLDNFVANSPVDLGEVVLFTRGERSWRLTVPVDGSLPEQGLIPAFIEWSPGAHPSTNMTDLGVSLESVNLCHPRPDELRQVLQSLGVDHLARVSSGDAKLSFTLKSPSGALITLD